MKTRLQTLFSYLSHILSYCLPLHLNFSQKEELPSWKSTPRFVSRINNFLSQCLRKRSVIAVAVGLLLAGISTGTGLAQSECTTVQISDDTTGGGVSRFSTLNSDGTRIAFFSTNDLTGNNADGNAEIFLFDTDTSTLAQITNDTTGSGGSLPPSINADGTRIAFYSDRDLTGNNTDGNTEIFLFDTDTSTLTQITNDTSGSSGSSFPSINADGTRIAFRSDRDLVGNNADTNDEIFLFDTDTSTLTQITNDTTGSGGSFPPSINADGTRIAFASDRDLTGNNTDENREIFLFDTDTSTLAQITNDTTGSGYSYGPSIDADGVRIAFASNRNLTGNNPDENEEVFLLDIDTSSLTQITDSTTALGSFAPSINAYGTRIAFDGGCEVFLFDINANPFAQLTNISGGGVCPQPSINADGTRIAFEYTKDLTGNNPDQNDEVFLAKRLAGDVDNDGDVDSADLEIFADGWRKRNNDPDWQDIQRLDLNRDGIITIQDISLAVTQMNETCS